MTPELSGSHTFRGKYVSITRWSHESTWATLYQHKWLAALAQQLIINPTIIDRHTSGVAEPNWELVSCYRQETDGLLGNKKQEKKHANRRPRPMFSFLFSLSSSLPPSSPYPSLEGKVRLRQQWHLEARSGSSGSRSRQLGSLGEF